MRLAIKRKRFETSDTTIATTGVTNINNNDNCQLATNMLVIRKITKAPSRTIINALVIAVCTVLRQR